MPAQLLDFLIESVRGLANAVVIAAGVAWRTLRPMLGFALQIVAALLLLFEEWGWRPLVAALERLSRFAPIARIERAVEALPPYAALLALAAPTALLLPLKFVAVYLLAQGHVVGAGALFVGAKVASTAIIARIFLLTRPALMQIRWFAQAYGLLMPWKERLFAAIRASWVWRYGRMLKTAVRLEAKKGWARFKPWAEARWLELRPRLAAASLRARAWLRLTRGWLTRRLQ